jgi:signal transduction histidine kinase
MLFFRNENLQQLFGFAELDTAELNKRMSLIQLGAFTAFAGSLYCLMYIFLGFPALAYTCLSYIAIYFINLAIFLATKNYNYYQSTQPFLILLAVFVSHVVLGGFINSSAVIFASFLAPVIALTFASQKTARVYYYLFLVSMLFAGFWDLFFVSSIPKVPKAIYITFFTTNFISIGSITYFLINGFLKKNLKLQEDLRQSLLHLELTQSQLIQSEKMASLGELTAGIAHEIQNPLNFVNNFSEVSVELFEEMEVALQKNDREEAVLIALDIKENLEKISHHGKRADAIVKGMLQHSRVSAGKKEPTDINALADEYLRLSYHGLRAKDKDFNATIETNFDASIGKIAVVQQDIGRVLLNLYNNAFYAVNEKKQLSDEGYKPVVLVTTRKENDKVVIVVRDNGNGIPQKVVDKIFQPFFTTKPTGQGTGLGLSLSYDIIKAHGGEVKVNNTKGGGAEFIIQLRTR